MLLVDTSIWVLAEHGGIDLTKVLGDDEAVAEMPDAPTPLDRFEEAARLYLRCRDAGVTVRSSIDCLVAATALAHDAAVFHDDRDFEHMKRVVPLRTVTRS